MKRKADFVMQKVGDVNVLVPIGTETINLNGLVVLNQTGSYVWNLLAEDRSAGDLAQAVAEQFDIDPRSALPDVQAFLDEIARVGLLEQ